MSDVIYLDSRGRPGTAELLDYPMTMLVGAALRWKRYRGWTTGLRLGHCKLCGAGFTEGGTSGLNSGYSVIGGGPAGQDDFVWICAICYEMRRDNFCWTVLDTRGAASRPPDLIETAFAWMAWPSLQTADDG